MRRVLSAADRWGAHLLSAYALEGRDQMTREKLERQLVLETSPQLEPFYDLAVEDVAVTGSDPFLAEGSDVSVLLRLKNAFLFTTRLEVQRREAASRVPSKLSVLHETYRTWEVSGIASADRSGRPLLPFGAPSQPTWMVMASSILS